VAPPESLWAKTEVEAFMRIMERRKEMEENVFMVVEESCGICKLQSSVLLLSRKIVKGQEIANFVRQNIEELRETS
jgi:hypothetical protein